MRLLNTTTIALEVFDNDPPPYAILSHRWEDEEVSFQDIEDGRAKEKRGYHKIQMACGIAATAGIEHIWVDTCCINKGDSAELSEAINSMYLWYEESTICYVYMSDLPSTWPIPTYSRNDFQKSRWFERGWTLQELLAPSAVVFLNNDWEEVGTKLNLWEYITARTGIPGIILHGQDVQSASIAQRMSWAADRRTTRIEDRAYSLMGLFGVNMPLLYGERQNAFLRLQEEIIKTSNDHSIFAW
ncbi:heterokaryon incompatibility protein-domain-containing protein, partial [Echria macrotheca]